jgi:DNA-binding response OmpR family regulator
LITIIGDLLSSSAQTVLVVEKDKLWRESLANKLMRFNFKVYQADSAFMALDKLFKAPKVDIVIANVDLPDLAAVDFYNLERKKYLSTHQKTPPVFIFISGIKNSEETQQLRSLGVDIFISHPIDFDFLRIAILQALAKIKDRKNQAA